MDKEKKGKYRIQSRKEAEWSIELLEADHLDGRRLVDRKGKRLRE